MNVCVTRSNNKTITTKQWLNILLYKRTHYFLNNTQYICFFLLYLLSSLLSVHYRKCIYIYMFMFCMCVFVCFVGYTKSNTKTKQ